MSEANVWLERALKARNAPMQIAQIGQKALTEGANCSNWPNCGDRSDPKTDPERTAIVAEGSGSPRLWAEAYASLCWTRNLPEGVTPAQWATIRNRVGRFIDRWASRAERLGWKPAEIVSVDWSSDAFRAFAAGEVVEITAEAVVFKIDGRRHVYGHDGRRIGGVG